MSFALELHHNDCRNFCNVDVAKGICRRTGQMVMVDGLACDAYQQLPKCKFCSNFADGAEGLGACKAEKNEPWAYPAMIAVTCEWFETA
jgi:4-hydroxyphenylacetate decarboxylase small subunit